MKVIIFTVRKILITSSIIFLLVGNILLPSIHILHEHRLNHVDSHCDKCTYFNNNKNFILGFSNVSFNEDILLDHKIVLFINYKLVTPKAYSSRAPPFNSYNI